MIYGEGVATTRLSALSGVAFDLTSGRVAGFRRSAVRMPSFGRAPVGRWPLARQPRHPHHDDSRPGGSGAREPREVRFGPDGPPEDADHSGPFRPPPRSIPSGLPVASGIPSRSQAGVGSSAAIGPAVGAREDPGVTGPSGSSSVSPVRPRGVADGGATGSLFAS